MGGEGSSCTVMQGGGCTCGAEKESEDGSGQRKMGQDDWDVGIRREPCPGHRLFFSSRHAGLQLPLHQLL